MKVIIIVLLANKLAAQFELHLSEIKNQFRAGYSPRSRLPSWLARAGWPGNQDLSFCDRDLGNRAENFSNFSHMNTPARIPGQNIFNCAWLVRSLTGRNAVPRVFWWPFGHFSSR